MSRFVIAIVMTLMLAACGGGSAGGGSELHTVGGSISGLTGAGLVLANGSDTRSVDAGATSFTLPTGLAAGSGFNVIVQTQPIGQTCSVAGGLGTMGSANVTSVVVTCSANTFTVGGSISGLTGSSLVLENGGDTLTVEANAGEFTFLTALPSGSNFDIKVRSQPAELTCSVANGSGVVGNANVRNAVVTCNVNAFTLGGSIEGLASSGLVLANGADTVAVDAGATTFAFTAPVAVGGGFDVTVKQQPTGQICSVKFGSGTMGEADVTPVEISCGVSAFQVGGIITGLPSSGGLVLTNGGDTLTVDTDGRFTFPTPVAFGSSFEVTVLSVPSGQTCSVHNGSGTMGAQDVESVEVQCSDKAFKLGGFVKGLTAGTLVLANGSDEVTVSADATADEIRFELFTPIASGSRFEVTVKSEPSELRCSVSNGIGTMGAEDVTSVEVKCSPNSFTLGGTIRDLTSNGLVLANGSDTLSVAALATIFSMPTAVALGSSFEVTVRAQPEEDICGVSNGSGTMGAANVTNVVVECSTNTFTVGGTISGLTGSGLVLANGSDTINVAANGPFTFTAKVAFGSSFNVTVRTPPTGQACRVSNGSGTMGAANVTNVVVECSTNTFTVGGTISGLTGSGLVLANGSDTINVAANGPFTFTAKVAFGSSFNVTVRTPPTGQTCEVSNGSGTMGAANVTNVVVECSTNTFTVGGTISGLTGSGLVLANGSDTINVAANGPFTFTAKVAFGSSFNVTVRTPPTGQTCEVSNGSGTMGAANVTNVVVECSTNTFTVGGTISGLTGSGLVLANGSDTINVAANGPFTFTAKVAFGSNFNVTVRTPPTGQTCEVSNGSGTMGAANVTNVVVECSTNTFTVGGTISGLTGSGLVLANGSDTINVAANGPFTFTAKVAFGSSFNVTVRTPPTGQACRVSNGIGTMGAANVTNVVVECSTNTFTVGGTINGLTGSGLVLANGSDTINVAANAGTFIFTAKVAVGSNFNVTVQTPPAGQTCGVSNGSGTMGAANVTNVAVECSTNTFTVGGTISGLTGSGLVLANGSDTINVAANGPFTFTAKVAFGSSFNVTVRTPPTGQACRVSNGSGTMGAANVTNVAVECSTNTFTVGGTISGLTGSGLVLANGSDTINVVANAGTFTFTAKVAVGSNFNVTVQTPPTGQTCGVSNGSGTMGAANVTNVVVDCSTNTFTVGGTIRGLTGSLVLANGTDTLNVVANAGTFTFTAPVAVGSSFNVTVRTPPTGQTCSVANGSGTMGAANVTNVVVDCSTNTFTVGGTIRGLTGSLVLANGTDTLNVVANAGTFTFTAPVAVGSSFNVTVLTPPTGQTCGVSNGSGTMGAANVTNVEVDCRSETPPETFTVSTFAGSGAIGSANGSGMGASFNNPNGIAVDGSGNLYVADQLNHKIRKITPAGVVSTFAGSNSDGSADGSGTAASFNNPRGVAVDGSGNVYVADTANYKIRKITPAGVVRTLAGSGLRGNADGSGTTASFNLEGVAVDGSGTVYVADIGNHKIRKITPAGVVSTFAGSGSEGSADGSGAAASFNLPNGVAVDGSGTVYVADIGNHKIRKITPVGDGVEVSTLAGSGEDGSADGVGTAASFSSPFGIAVDGSGNLYVTQFDGVLGIGQHKIRKITPAGVVSTIAGTGPAGNDNGSGTAASFSSPTGIAVDGSGAVYVADRGNRKVRKITRD